MISPTRLQQVSEIFSIFSSPESQHLHYLQLRKSILESQILCSNDDLISLGGLALQSEVGDYDKTVCLSKYWTT